MSLVWYLFRWTSASATIRTNSFPKIFNRKKLDPLEAYVPAVILTELQIKDLGNSLSCHIISFPWELENLRDDAKITLAILMLSEDAQKLLDFVSLTFFFFYCTLTLRMFLHPRTKQETWTQLGIKEDIDSVPWCFNLFFDYCRENSGCWSASIRQLSIFITFWSGSISSCKYSSSKSTSLALFILYLIACETFFIPGEFS